MKFFNLHHHTTYSFLDGYGTPEQILARVSFIGQDGCAITDHGNIYGHVPFAKAFRKGGKHLVLGIEFYVVEKIEPVRGYYHTTVIAKTNEGYQNLLKLVNLSYQQSYYKPRVTFQQLKDHSRGLIFLTGCFSDGLFVKNPLAEKLWLKYLGKTEWYFELQPFQDMKAQWAHIVESADKLGKGCVVTFDCHYPSPEDRQTHDFMLAINTNRPLSDPDRLKMDFPLHMPGVDEVIDRCSAVGTFRKEWLELSWNVAMSCHVDMPKTSMVKLNIGIDDLKRECLKALKARKLDKKKEYVERLNYELGLIHEKNFMDYFYIIVDLMKWAKKRMLCGPGRGSSAGSLVCYLMGITELDPIKFGLLFERFIDINRADLPDIDLDFPASKRGEVIAYLKQRYGQERTKQLVTFNTFKPKAIIQDAARVLQIPRWEATEATSQMIERSGGDARADYCLEDSLQQYDKLQALFQKYPKLKDSIKLEGQIRQIGKHAAAVAIAADPLCNVGSINNDILSIDKYDAEDAGILKIDILGLETLDIIQDICDWVGFDSKKFYDLPLDDPLTFEKVFTPSKVMGVFQFEGLSVRQVCEYISPTTFNHLVHITALGRPGPLNSRSTLKYVERFKAGGNYEKDPILEPYTSDTLGIIVYQEQVMNVVRNIGKFSWKDTSTIRKAMSKNLGEEFLKKYTDAFVEGAVSQGIHPDKARAIFNNIYTFGSWAFNLSHAASYALVSYWMGYCKAHWPAYFYARILKNKVEEWEIIPLLKEYGGDFIPLDINKSKEFFSVDTDGKTLIGGLTNVKGIGEAAAKKIIAGRPYDNMEDFCSRVPAGISSKIAKAVKEGLPWAEFTKMKDRIIMPEQLSAPLKELKDIVESPPNHEYTTLGRVININLKDHNEDEKVQKRGYRMKGFTEYVVLRVTDDNFDIYYICFDKHTTQKHKQTLLSSNGRICIFKIVKVGGDLMLGKKVMILDEKTK